MLLWEGWELKWGSEKGTWLGKKYCTYPHDVENGTFEEAEELSNHAFMFFLHLVQTELLATSDNFVAGKASTDGGVKQGIIGRSMAVGLNFFELFFVAVVVISIFGVELFYQSVDTFVLNVVKDDFLLAATFDGGLDICKLGCWLHGRVVNRFRRGFRRGLK